MSEGDPFFKSAYATSHIEHIISLNLDAEGSKLAQPTTSIMCQIGPETNNPDIMVRMIEGGMRIAKIPCGKRGNTQEYMMQVIKNLREAAETIGEKKGIMYPLGISMETRGAQLCLGSMEGNAPVELNAGDRITLTTDKEFADRGSAETLFVDYPKMTHDMEPSFFIYINYGFVKLTVLEVGIVDVVCNVDCGGYVKSYDVVHLPSNSIALPTLSDADVADIKFAVEQKLDYLFIAWVRKGETIRQTRELLGDHGARMLIIACIEDQEGFDNADEIVAEADGIFIARGNLAINLSQEKLFVAQKILSAKCQMAGKPVVTGTQMLFSMVSSPHAASADIFDIANAVWEGVDCLVLNDETHHGRYPLECIKMMADVCREAENCVWQRQIFSEIYSQAVPPVEPLTAISIAAVKCSMKIRASAILVTTSTGHSAVWLSRFCPVCPIIAISRASYIVKTLLIYKKIYPIHYRSPPLCDWPMDVDARLQFGITYGKQLGFIRPNDPVLLVSGWRPGSGYTNSIRLIFASGEVKRPRKEQKETIEAPLFDQVSATGSDGGSPE